MMTTLDKNKVEKLRKELEGKNKTETKFEVLPLSFINSSVDIVIVLLTLLSFVFIGKLILQGKKEVKTDVDGPNLPWHLVVEL